MQKLTHYSKNHRKKGCDYTNINYVNLEALDRFKENVYGLLPKYINGLVIHLSDWNNNEFTINCSSIGPNSIVNIYYAEATKIFVESYNLTYTLGDGFVKITTDTEIVSDLVIDVIEIKLARNPISFS